MTARHKGPGQFGGEASHGLRAQPRNDKKHYPFYLTSTLKLPLCSGILRKSKRRKKRLSRKMTGTTLVSGKVTLSVTPKRRVLLRKIHALAGMRKKSISEEVWDLCERGLEKQIRMEQKPEVVSLPSADLGRVLVIDRRDLYDDILVDRL
jgi:hypothetical protein